MTKLKNDRHTSTKKSERQNIKRKKRNILIKNKIKKTLKKMEAAIASGNVDESKKLLKVAMKTLQTSSRKNILPDNAASRKISQLSKKINSMKK